MFQPHIRPWPAAASRRRRVRDPPLASDALVDKRLAVGGQRGDLGFDERAHPILLLRPVQDCAHGFVLFIEGR